MSSWTASDWSEFDGLEEMVCYCRCSGVFKSHAKVVHSEDGKSKRLVTRKACPACGRNDSVWNARGSGEMAIKG